jgi:hypothetical protein
MLFQHRARQCIPGCVDMDYVRVEQTSTEKAKGIWLCADHFRAQYRKQLWLGVPQPPF